jgi:hypothetical protein
VDLGRDASEREFHSETQNLLQSCFAQVSGPADIICEHFTPGTNRPNNHLQTELRVKSQNLCRLRACFIVAAEFNVDASEAKVVPKIPG